MGGLSLGEYSALTAAGAMDFETAVQLVYKRKLYAKYCSFRRRRHVSSFRLYG